MWKAGRMMLEDIVASAVGESSAYFLFLSVVECALLVLIAWYAWTWPRRQEE